MILLRQHEYASRDYEGLDAQAQKELRKQRNKIAADLWKTRKSIKHDLKERHDDYVSGVTKYDRALVRGKFDKAEAIKANNPDLGYTPVELRSNLLSSRGKQYQIAQHQAQNEASKARKIALAGSNLRNPKTTVTADQPKSGMSTGGKVALGVAGAGALAAGGHALYKHLLSKNKKKKSKEKEL